MARPACAAPLRDVAAGGPAARARLAEALAAQAGEAAAAAAATAAAAAARRGRAGLALIHGLVCGSLSNGVRLTGSCMRCRMKSSN